MLTDWWDVNDPTNRGRYFWEPPLFYCRYGTATGASCEWSGRFGGSPQREVTEVLTYESGTLPTGTFENAMKVKISTFDDSLVTDEPLYFWLDNNIGPFRTEEVISGTVIVLVSHSLGKVSGISKIAETAQPPTSATIYHIKSSAFRWP